MARRRHILSVVGALAVVVGVAAATAGGPTSNAQSGHRGGTLIILTPDNPGSVDTAINYGTGWAELILTHDGLVAFRKVGGAKGGELVPDLASALPKASNGGRTYTFRIRSGIRYSDGTTLKASDFTNVFERMFKVKGPTAGAFYSTIVGAKACLAKPATCNLSKSIVANDATRTLTFRLTRADGEFLQKLALPFAFAVPQSAPDTDAGTKPLPGTGAYMWAEYTPNRQIRLVRNTFFREWSAAAQPRGFVDGFTIKFGLPLEAEITQVQNGQADAILSPGGLPADRLGELSTKYARQTHLNPVPAVFYMIMNTKVAPFNNVLVRRAINYATDRNATSKIFGGSKLARPTCQVLPPNFPGYRPYCPYSKGGGGTTWRAPDLAKARELVERSGTKGMEITIVNPNIPPGKSTGLYFRDLLNSLGYKAKLKLLALPVFDPLVKNSRNKIQMNLQVWFADYPAPSNFLYVLTSCAGFRANNDSNPNVAEFCDRKISAQMEKALALGATNPAAANRLWASIDRKVTDQAPWVSLMNPQVVTFVSKRLGNYQFNPQWQLLFSKAWVQ